MRSFSFGRIRKFFAEARQEFRHINWPTRREALYLTAIVVALALLLAGFLGLSDYVFLNILELII